MTAAQSGATSAVREIGARFSLRATARTSYVLSATPAIGVPVADETLSITLDGEEIGFEERLDEFGARLQLFESGAGELVVDYSGVVTGRAPAAAVDPLDPVIFLRPSRYCPADSLTPFARETFPGLAGLELVQTVTAWVHDRLRYLASATTPTGGALETLEAGAGVCRDFSHLLITLLRALDIPARMVAVYAPGLVPMDFHAVTEALVDGRWIVLDATGLAPRRQLVRMSTGRDAADTAFLTNTLSDVELLTLAVRADLGGGADPGRDDPAEIVELG